MQSTQGNEAARTRAREKDRRYQDKCASIEKEELFPLLEQRFDMCNKVCGRSDVERLRERVRDAYQPHMTPHKISEIIKVVEQNIRHSLFQRTPEKLRGHYNQFSLEKLYENVARL
ncbi:hypothetical protein ASPBRDRAFT_29178 [Aspergillus brasiliensis CBS 101740]|uniref:Uncharacterized protein n=1 Tax=Aspergillus brasiliensis (strain CBS 101740 / IMI 381727 / IBT 21946) TaxID=767769 RepID=A0A1L9UR31_ASPBC|nr:hypothetical protein ASPBRDRAFT_29178 [Aspergillus brasiliensis CBS 101740]